MSSTSNRLLSATGPLTRSYSYDAAGNTTSDGTRSFTYNDAGRMKTSTKAGVTTTYSYNGLGERVKKTSSASTTYFAYDEAGHLIGEYDAAGDSIQETVWLGDIPVATLKPTVGGGVSVFYIHTDHLNTPRRITRRGDNAIVWRWDSDPFGATAANDDADGDTLTFAYNLRFPGQYFDAETGLHYNYFRDYDPGTGRYLQSDPIGVAGGINTYAYVVGNPLSNTDSTGQVVDGLADAGFIIWDLWRLLQDNALRDCDNLGENLTALGADTAGLFLPFVTGLGAGVRATRAAEVAAEVAAKAAAEASAKAAAEAAARVQAQKLLANQVLHDHHLMPQQFSGFFSSRGINIHDHTVTLSEQVHLRGVHGSGAGNMPGRWNQQWSQWIEANPNARAKDIYQQLGRMMDDFGLGGYRIHPFGK